MNKKPLPKFASEEEERAFWADNDSTDYVDWSKAQNVVFPNLKPSRRTISIRMPESLLASNLGYRRGAEEGGKSGQACP